MSTIEAPAGSTDLGAKLYRAVWRWHFYAGLIVVPFLVTLSITGMIILWVTAVSPEYGDWLKVPVGKEPMRISAQADAALAAYPAGKIGQYIAPVGPENPALFRVDLPEGARMLAVDPYTGSIVRDRPQAGTWNEFATNIHGELLLGGNGGVGDFIIEVAASLGIVMLATGLYLFWPRGLRTWRSAVVPSFSSGGRSTWKSLHSTVGFWMSIVLLFFLISGLAWAGIWGEKMTQAWSTFPPPEMGRCSSVRPYACHDEPRRSQGSSLDARADADAGLRLECRGRRLAGRRAGCSGVRCGPRPCDRLRRPIPGGCPSRRERGVDAQPGFDELRQHGSDV